MLNYTERWKLAWSILWEGIIPSGMMPVPSGDLIDVDHPYVHAVRDAVEKVEADLSFRTASPESKRKEALLWAGHYLRDRYRTHQPESAWSFNFLVEYLVGKRRGYL